MADDATRLAIENLKLAAAGTPRDATSELRIPREGGTPIIRRTPKLVGVAAGDLAHACRFVEEPDELVSVKLKSVDGIAPETIVYIAVTELYHVLDCCGA